MDKGFEEKQAGISRRQLLKGAGVLGLGAVGTGLVGCAPKTSAAADDASKAAGGATTPASTGSFAEGALDLGWTGTPSSLVELGMSTMPLAELNRRRQAYLDAQTDYTCADGTVIPAVFVKVRALINSYGMGCGNTHEDGAWEGILQSFSEDDAEMFISMPFGEKFTSIDLYEKTGRPLEECSELCDRLADEGFLCRFSSNNGTMYHQVPYFQGVIEYQFTKVVEDTAYNPGVATSDMFSNPEAAINDMRDGGTPTFYAIPCDKSVVADEEGVLPFDDIEKVIMAKDKLAIAPCYCRYTTLIKNGETDYPTFADFATAQFEDYFSPVCDQRVETCLMMGDEAEFWIEQGWGREISREDAIRYMKRSADDGFILESCFSKDSATICSCHAKSCGIIAEWSALGGADEIGAANAFKQISHYMLEVDYDACAKCGTCANRCPLQAISMDGEVNGETGVPKVNAMCFRCGQCAYVCPQHARKLAARPKDMNAELPRDFLDDANRKAAYRFEQGLIAEPA